MEHLTRNLVLSMAVEVVPIDLYFDGHDVNANDVYLQHVTEHADE